MPGNRGQHSDLHATLELAIAGVRIDVNKYVQQFTFKDVSQAAGEGTVVMFDEEWDVLETFLSRVGNVAPIQFRFGFEDHFSQDLEMKMLNYVPTFTQAGVVITLNMLNKSIAANLRAITQAYAPVEGLYPRISDIVEEIAKRNKWEYLIEPTKVRSGEAIIQNNVPDTHFMTQELQKLAVNEKGQSGYRVFLDRNNVLHFHTPDFVAHNKREVYRTYNFARDIDGEVLEFAPEDKTVMMATVGGYDANFECADQRKKRPVVIEGRAKDKAKDNIIGGGKIWPVHDGKEFNRWITRPFKSPEELEAYAKYRQTWFAQMTFDATLRILGDPHIRPMDYVVVNVLKKNGEPHKRWSGKYRVNELEHEITSGSFTTTCSLTRQTGGMGTVSVFGKEIPLSMRVKKGGGVEHKIDVRGARQQGFLQ